MKFLITAAIAGLAFCGRPGDPGAVPAPAAPTAAAEPAGQSPAGLGRLCTVREGRLVEVDARIDAATGDTVLDGRPLREAYEDEQSPFARARAWFRSDAPIPFQERTYYKNAPPLKFPPGHLMVVGHFGGTPLFVEAAAGPRDPSILYVLVDASCLFQGYYLFN